MKDCISAGRVTASAIRCPKRFESASTVTDNNSNPLPLTIDIYLDAFGFYFPLRCLAGAQVKIHSTGTILPSGAETVLRCEASGDQPLTVYWRRYDQLVSEMDRLQLMTSSSSLSSQSQYVDLNISRVEADDAGAYICYASNAYGSHASEIRLIVQGMYLFLFHFIEM